MIIIPLTYILLITNFISIFFSFSALNFAAIFAFILSLIVPYDEAMDMGAGGSRVRVI